ncbi:SH3 domain-containing protein [Salidesulfovibrio onnuriiensis]|uniref:SH3 domain-containing protein n=1 Tax=Salidesulfovibrio onnuriiensis TaxID=2583823 RepID=UPI00164F670F|nr:NlpC/P60 family N-terminal domain-containing protein [Salidesulfovibrio onnuriiensis]
MKHICNAFCLLSILLVSACAMPRPGMIRDLDTLPQDAGAYHGLDADAPLLSPGLQAGMYARFLRKHYGPWAPDFQPVKEDAAYWALTHYSNKEIFGQNTLKRNPEWMRMVAEEARKDAYPSMSRPCIAVTNTSMRSLPTREPVFWDFRKPGEGFPFDYMQNSQVLAGTPLRAEHISKSGQWVFVESRFTFGWVPVRDIAWTDSEFMNAFNAPAMIAVTRDEVPVRDIQDRFRFTANIGTVLPLAQRPDNGCFKTLIPVRDAQGNAVAVEADICRTDAELMPLPATPRTFAKLANAMLGRPYGWGACMKTGTAPQPSWTSWPPSASTCPGIPASNITKEASRSSRASVAPTRNGR